jgi:hypothetical protein
MKFPVMGQFPDMIEMPGNKGRPLYLAGEKYISSHVAGANTDVHHFPRLFPSRFFHSEIPYQFLRLITSDSFKTHSCFKTG